MFIRFSEPITLSPEAATEVFRILENLYVDTGNQLSTLVAIEELRQFSEAGARPIAPEKLAEFKQRAAEIPPKVRARVKESIQQLHHVFDEARGERRDES
jgi:hypothetical protein